MKKRLIFYEVSQYLEHKNALVITGLRQVGKTTLLRQLLEQIASPYKVWLDLDNPLDQKILEDLDYRVVYERLRQLAGAPDGQRLFVFIDEIQNFPPVTKIIKFLIDHYQVKFIVTGSSNFYLKNIFPESLAGRKFLYDIPPLTFTEYLYFRDVLTLETAQTTQQQNPFRTAAAHSVVESAPRLAYYDEYLSFGGFPEVVTTPDQATKRRILKQIVGSFFEKDIHVLADYADIRELRDLLLLLVPRVGSLLDVSKIASELGVARPKIYHYLEFLQGTFMIRLLGRFSKSIDRSVAGGRKVYFTDTGLLSTLGSVNDGQLLENAVVNQLAAYGQAVSFYRERAGAEIDLIFDKKVALEIKVTGATADLVTLERRARRLKLATSYVVSKKFVEHPNIISPLFF